MFIIWIFDQKENNWIKRSSHKNRESADANFEVCATAGKRVRMCREGLILREE
jgi:hypothetical protein